MLQALPRRGIKIFASQLHTHLTGKAVYTKHVRGGVELPELNRDNHYSPHFQEIRRLPQPVHVLPVSGGSSGWGSKVFGHLPLKFEKCPFYLGFLGFLPIYLGFFHYVMVLFFYLGPPPPNPIRKAGSPGQFDQYFKYCLHLKCFV